MTSAGLVRAGEERVDDPESRAGAYPSSRDAVFGTYDSIRGPSCLESADDSGPNCDNAATAVARRADRHGGRRWDRIRLVEREEIVELRIAGRGNAGGVGQRRKDDVAGAHCDNALPVERKTGGRRL